MAASMDAVETVEANTVSFAEDQRVRRFAGEMQQKHGFALDEILKSLAAAKRLPSVLQIIQKQPEERASWPEYRVRFVNPQHIEDGKRFMSQHRQVLTEAQTTYGVPPAVVTAIIGVESNYGRLHQSYRALDALATLAFSDYRRAAFFRNELEQLFLLARIENRSPLSYRSSFAGAIGWGQFLPSSYRNYGTDFNGDGQTNLQNDPEDVIGSVANYLAGHGWLATEPIIVPANLKAGDRVPEFSSSLKPAMTVRQAEREFGLIPQQPGLRKSQRISLWRFSGQQPPYWMGLDNFYVLSRYNPSSRYTMAVFLLSQSLSNN